MKSDLVGRDTSKSEAKLYLDKSKGRVYLTSPDVVGVRIPGRSVTIVHDVNKPDLIGTPRFLFESDLAKMELLLGVVELSN